MAETKKPERFLTEARKYLDGLECEVDYARGIPLVRRAIANGEAGSKDVYTLCQMFGLGVPLAPHAECVQTGDPLEEWPALILSAYRIGYKDETTLKNYGYHWEGKTGEAVDFASTRQKATVCGLLGDNERYAELLEQALKFQECALVHMTLVRVYSRMAGVSAWTKRAMHLRAAARMKMPEALKILAREELSFSAAQLRLYAEAAERGDIESQYTLGTIYCGEHRPLGFGGHPPHPAPDSLIDRAAARVWLRRAAENGVAAARDLLHKYALE